MPGTEAGSGQWITIGDDKHELIYTMLSLEKIEAQFGSVAEMQSMITNEEGAVTLDRPVVKLLIDIVHAGLLHEYADTPEARRTIATGIPPSRLDEIVTAFTVAFTDAFGALGEQALAGEVPGPTPIKNRADRRAGSRSSAGTTSPASSSGGRKKSGKK
jgi:hypothetical protein